MKPRLFFVLGLPRSKTAWAANLLTWGPSICFHEPSRLVGSMADLRARLEAVEGFEFVGASDCGLACWPEEFLAEFGGEPRAAIRRADNLVHQSLKRWLPQAWDPSAVMLRTKAGLNRIAEAGGLPTIDFALLGHDLDQTLDFWTALGLPKDAFNATRCRELATLKVEVGPGRYAGLRPLRSL